MRTHTVHYTSADGPGEDSTWSVYREEYASQEAHSPIDGSQVYVSTHSTQAEADREATRLQIRGEHRASRHVISDKS